MGEGMKHGLTKAVLGMYLVSTFVFCVTLAKDDPSGRSIWARMRPDAGSLGMYCISSAYPNFTLPDAVQAAADDGQRAQQTAPDTLTLTGTDGSEAQISEIITTEETAPEPVVFGEEPAVLIVHTHATESYLPSSEGNYHRKGKLNTVRDAGDVLAETLDEAGIPCVHDVTLHDEKSYNKAYSRSYETTEALLKKYPSIECVIDLHRDAVPGEVSVATVSVGGKKCAKYSYVVSNAVETYASNLAFIRKMNETATKKYDGFTGNILERGYRYNQNLSDKYMLLEIGYNRNDIEEVRCTAEMVGKILADTLKSEK